MVTHSSPWALRLGALASALALLASLPAAAPVASSWSDAPAIVTVAPAELAQTGGLAQAGILEREAELGRAVAPAAIEPSSLRRPRAGHGAEAVESTSGGVIVGRVERTVADMADGSSVDRTVVLTAGGPVRVDAIEDVPEGFANGAFVRLAGSGASEGVVAADGGAAQVLATAPAWSGPRRVAVALVNFANNGSRPFSRSFVNGVIFTRSDSVRAYFAEASHGDFQLTGRVFDWMRLPYRDGSCDYRAWESATRSQLAERGVDLSAFTNLMIVFPHTDACGWRGLGHLPGPTSWINGAMALRTPAHELAHNLGVHHANALRCSRDGKRVALSSHCRSTEYGDPFSTMGRAATRHTHGLELVQLGFLPATATRTVTASGTYRLAPTMSSDGVRVLGIARPDGTWLYLTYRRPYGTAFDDFATTAAVVHGVTIRLGRDWSTIIQSQLVDTRPGTTTFADASLRVDHSFRDYLSGVRIAVVSAGRTGATVRVTIPGT